MLVFRLLNLGGSTLAKPTPADSQVLATSVSDLLDHKPSQLSRVFIELLLAAPPLEPARFMSWQAWYLTERSRLKVDSCRDVY